MITNVTARFIIGIDPGVSTGFAIWDRQQRSFVTVKSGKIHQIMAEINNLLAQHTSAPLFVRLEDARLRTWFGRSGVEKLQGAGSIKRDCGIWAEYLESLGVPFELVPPRKNRTKTDSIWFSKITGWKKKTNNHARDAGMLVLDY